MRFALAVLLGACALVLAPPALADSGSITNVGPFANGQVQATFTSTVDQCAADSYCGWFAFATAEDPSVPCYADSPNVIYVGPLHDSLGTETATHEFFVQYPSDRLCLFASAPSGTNEELTEYLYSPPAPPPVVTPTPTAPTPENTPAAPPQLGKSEAGGDVRAVLHRKFRKPYAHRAEFHSRCSRLSRTKFRCRVSWLQVKRCHPSCGRAGFEAVASFKGTVTVWNPSDPNADYFNYSFRIKRHALAGGRNTVYVSTATAKSAVQADANLASVRAQVLVRMARSCGTIRPKSLEDLVPPHNMAHITTHGSVSCNTAKRTMKILFRHGGNTTTPIHGWHCVGPQTGFAKCTRPRKSITATF